MSLRHRSGMDGINVICSQYRPHNCSITILYQSIYIPPTIKFKERTSKMRR